ncbi:hypothetical protein [Desulfuromonas sp. TF]|uniref:hypothetical protein n=1 Tax=Desulfuromonas sp. TF TaxID=1232410 RepID=UPI00041C0D3E|nr:hypothetical protein [Desulfuromonas sp. TF]
MRASELISQLQDIIAIHGDKEMAIDDGQSLRPIEEVDVTAEEDEDAIVLWMD